MRGLKTSPQANDGKTKLSARCHALPTNQLQCAGEFPDKLAGLPISVV